MWYFTELANKWDMQRGLSEKELESFVDRNPNLVGVITATAIHTSMALGSGFVDLLRLGDGITKESSIKGAVKDGLRLVGIAGPAGKGLQMLKGGKNLRLASLIVDIGGPRCSWIAATKAMVQTGNKVKGKLFTTVEDLAKALGVHIRRAKGIDIRVMTHNLRRIGAHVGPIKTISSIKEATKMLRRNGSVVMMSVKVMKNGKQTGGHALYIFYDLFGRLRIMDRTGIHKSLSEVVKKYNADELIPRAAAKLSNVYGKIVGPKGSVVLAMEVLGVLNDNPDDVVQFYKDKN